MGADLYLHGDYEANRDAIKPDFDAACAKRDAAFERGDKVVGDAIQTRVEELYAAMFPPHLYFRDSYNATSLLWRLKLNWWRLEDAAGPLIDGECLIRGENLQRFRELVANREPTYTDDFFEPWTEPREEVEQYFADKKKQLLEFLDHAAASGKAIYASV